MTFPRTVILDWDGTLAATIPDGIITRPVHAVRAMEINLVSVPMDRDGRPGKYILILRPHFYELILSLSTSYNLILWSFGAPEYVNYCVNATGLHKVFKRGNMLTREDMLAYKTAYKDIYLLTERFNITLNNTLIVDDANSVFGVLNPYNCVDIPTWQPALHRDASLRSLPELIEKRFTFLERFSEEDLIRKRAEILLTLKEK